MFEVRTPCAGVSFGRLEANWRAGGHGPSIHVGTHRKGVHHRQWGGSLRSPNGNPALDTFEVKNLTHDPTTCVTQQLASRSLQAAAQPITGVGLT